MSFISIILPAFHLKTSDKKEIIKFCSTQFNLSQDKFELLSVNDNTNNNNYVIKFKESSLSLNSIEDLIYQRECIKSISEKTFESLKITSDKLSELENQIKSFNENGNNIELNKNLIDDNLKLRELLKAEIEHSENFRINTEKTLNKIRGQFSSIVKELETMRKKTNKIKPIVQRENTLSNNNSLISLGKKNKTNNSNSSDNKNKNNLNNNKVPKLNFKQFFTQYYLLLYK